MRYAFKHEEITCCTECPLFYDYINCEIEENADERGEYTWRESDGRPSWCPLEEEP